MICLLCQMNMCVMSCILEWILHAFFWCSEILQVARVTVPNSGFSHISPCPYILFFLILFVWNRAKAFVAHVRKSTHATEEFRNLQKQQVLKDTPGGTSLITNPEVDESEENEGEEEAGYSNEDGQLTGVLALRVPVDTRWNSLYYMIER